MSNQFYSAVERDSALNEALNRVAFRMREQLPDADLAFVFFAGYEPDEIDRHASGLRSQLGVSTLLGCSAVGLVCNSTEIENEPAVSIWAARLPGTQVLPMHLRFHRSPDGDAIVGWPEETESEWPEDCNFVLLAEPYGFPVEAMLERMNEDRPAVKIAGGISSGGTGPGLARLILNDDVLSDGAVAVRINGAVRIQTMVSQGCRPIGTPLVITRCERNQIFELGGQPALIQLKKIYDTLPTREQRLVQSGLHVGRVIDEYKDRFDYGDFLIRNVVGIDSDTGSISITDFVRPGQTVQFHLRDQETASFDLQEMLQSVSAAEDSGELLFTCNGRGLNLFPEPNHDAALICKQLSAETADRFPLGGFFAAGEIGPVAGSNFLHGFTASLIVLS